MTAHHGPITNCKSYPKCKCGTFHLERHEFYYHCTKCDEGGEGTSSLQQYNMCRACALTKAGILGRVDRFKLHNGGKCEMTKGVENSFTAWMCEGSSSKRGCLTGINNEIESSTY